MKSLSFAIFSEPRHPRKVRLKDYFLGRKLVLNSSLPREEVQRRINAATPSMWWPFRFDRVLGGAQFGRVRLRYQASPIDYNAKPILSGRLCENLVGTEIELRFGAPARAKLFFLFWYAFLAFLAAAIASATSGVEPSAGPIILIVFPLFFLMPIVMHFAFTRDSDDDLARLVEFLEREAGARLVP